MKSAIRFFLFFLIADFAFVANAQDRFIENGGQWPVSVTYRADVSHGKMYIERDRFTFDFYDHTSTDAVFAAHGGMAKPKPVPDFLTCHSYQMIFDGAYSGALPIGKNAFHTKYSFFQGSNSQKWAGNLAAFEEVRYAEIYSGIDLKVYFSNTLKYDFILKPYANVNQIKVIYQGVKPHVTTNGQLEISLGFTTVFESKPFAYQIIDNTITAVDCAYTLSSNELSFQLGAYREDLELIIDPELTFSTYSGSTSDNFGYTATFDAEGHLFSGSSAFGTGYPSTIGAYQATWAGGQGAGSLAGTDIALSKFSLDGTSLLYSTFLGGSKDELPHSLITDSIGNLYLLGTSGSSDFPTTPGCFQDDFQGGTATVLGGIGVAYTEGADIVVCRIGVDGTTLDASTYIGGSGNDGTNTSVGLRHNYADEVRGEIELDQQGNIIIGSSTFSDNFPLATTAFQSIKNAGQEGVVFRMDPSLSSIEAATFFGGAGNDAIYSIDVDALGNITVGGGTSSTDLATTPSAYQENFGGGSTDGFIAVFNADFTLSEAITYYGSAAYDQIYFIERDEFGSPHIFGQTEASGNTFIENAAYNTPNSGMLLSKFSTNLQQRIWSTVFGNGQNTPNLSPTAFSVDICNRIYLSGWGGLSGNGAQGNTLGMEVTDDAFKSTTNGNDFYFMVLSGDADELTFASFFGGNQSSEHVDGGTSRFDRSGKIYQAVCAGCGGNDDFPIFPENALSPTNNSSNCNLGVAKINFDLPLIFADFEAENVCLPAMAEFENQSSSYTGSNAFYTWIFPNGDTSFDENPSYQFTESGLYEVKLVISEANACNISDTIVKTIQVFPEVQLIVADSVVSCSETEFILPANSFGTSVGFQWASDPFFSNILLEGQTDSILSFSTFIPTTLYIKVDNGLCQRMDSIAIIPAPTLALSVGDTLLCSVQKLEIALGLSEGTIALDINWQPDNSILSGQNEASILLNASADILLSVDVTTDQGCQLADSISVKVDPISLSTSGDTLACQESEIRLLANSNGLAQSFEWSSSSSFSNILNSNGDSTIFVVPSSIMYYYVRVQNGDCALTDSLAVSTLVAGTSISNDIYVCANDTATLFISNDFPGSQLQHLWDPEEYIISGQATQSITVVVDEPTTFNVVSTTADGCTVENSTTVFTSSLGSFEVDAIAEPQNILVGNSAQLSAFPEGEEYLYQWFPATYLSNAVGASSVSTPPESITYLLTISDFNDLGVCSKSDSIRVTVYEFICGEPNIFVPNAFTPNDDGENDRAVVRGGNISDIYFAIYDRWGELLFESRDQNRGWDGEYKGNLAEPAVYVYYLEVRCGDGQEYFDKGNITLLR